jgi:hypothetical protein
LLEIKFRPHKGLFLYPTADGYIVKAFEGEYKNQMPNNARIIVIANTLNERNIQTKKQRNILLYLDLSQSGIGLY